MSKKRSRRRVGREGMVWKRNIYTIAGISDAVRVFAIQTLAEAACNNDTRSELEALRLYAEILDEGRIPDAPLMLSFVIRQASGIITHSPQWHPRRKRLDVLMPAIKARNVEAIQEAVMLLRDNARDRVESERREAVHRRQSERGREGAAVRWEANANIGQIVANLAQEKDELGDPLPPSDVWPLLYSALDLQGKHPEQTDEVCVYDGGQITYDTFARQLRRKRPRT